MRKFFRSRTFRIMIGIVAFIVAITVVFSIFSGTATPVSSMIGTVTGPIQGFFSDAGEKVRDFFGSYSKYDKLKKEYEDVKSKYDKLLKEKIEWEQDKAQKAFYEDFLDIKRKNTDYKFATARVIARDPADVYGSFTINVGNVDGVSAYDPVITANGLVGYVSTVAATYSTVKTVLDPTLKVSSYDTRSNVSGIVCGDPLVVENGMCRMTDIAKGSSVAQGDYIVTAGGGVFPEGLMIGTVKEVGRSKDNIQLYADVETSADIKGCSNVMVITSFDGQSTVDSYGK